MQLGKSFGEPDQTHPGDRSIIPAYDLEQDPLLLLEDTTAHRGCQGKDLDEKPLPVVHNSEMSGVNEQAPFGNGDPLQFIFARVIQFCSDAKDCGTVGGDTANTGDLTKSIHSKATFLKGRGVQT
ncbi:hypothetical protein MG293_002641 [Ovis ammon polii]|uniref:Uncharacterized protein n=1 Tax=Ovis ammon polii TaxID=230172 RepID=A0AAD4YGR1_OVIAM|nr:hypothetical protein MG293_002641 [Ovis ammon polii]